MMAWTKRLCMLSALLLCSNALMADPGPEAKKARPATAEKNAEIGKAPLVASDREAQRKPAQASQKAAKSVAIQSGAALDALEASQAADRKDMAEGFAVNAETGKLQISAKLDRRMPGEPVPLVAAPTDPLGCPDGSVFGQVPHGPEDEWTGGTADANVGYQRFESYTTMFGASICNMKWVAMNRFYDGAAWNECTRNPDRYDVIFYPDDGTGMPDTANPSFQYLGVTPVKTVTGLDYSGRALYMYELDLTTVGGCCTQTSGWVSITGYDDGHGCWQLWLSSPEGDGESILVDDTGAASVEDFDLNVCFSGPVDPGACCDNNSGTCTEGATWVDCDTNGARFIPNGVCDDFDPACGLSYGACCLGTDCGELTDDVCASLGGLFLGDGTDCTTSTCPGPGDSCLDPLKITLPAELPYSTVDTIVGRGDDYNTTCMGNYDGDEDIIYQLVIEQDVCLNLSVLSQLPDGTGPQTWVGMAIFDICPADGDPTCLYQATSTANPDVIEGAALSAGIYYLMIDNYPAPYGANFTLTIEECPVGGCCLTDGCAILAESECVAGGGNYLGDGTDCSGGECATGACCVNGTCDELSDGDCVAAGGEFQGGGTSCANTICPTAGDTCEDPFKVTIPADLPFNQLNTTIGRTDDFDATCMGNYDSGFDMFYQLVVQEDTCLNISVLSDTTWTGIAIMDICPADGEPTCLYQATTSANPDVIQNAFLAAGTYYLMLDTFASPDECTFDISITTCPYGGCCIEGVCSLEYEDACMTAGGMFVGDGTDCSGDPCSVGACCDAGSCSITTSTECAGVYLGDATSCQPGVCDECDCPTTVTAPYCSNFDDGTTGDWVQSLEDDTNFTVLSGATGSSGTGPTGDHTTGSGYYIYTEASSHNNELAIIDGPCVDLSALTAPAMQFWYHMWGGDMGTLAVEVSTTNCVTWDRVWELSGDQGNQWSLAQVDLSAYAGMTIHVRFWAMTGDGFESDISIDDVCFDEFMEFTGACCLPDYTCEEAYEADCIAAGGLYKGDATTCDAVICPRIGDTCEDPIVVNIPADIDYVDANDTIGRGNNYDDTCLDEGNNYDGGEDIIYELVVAEDSCIDVSVQADTTYVGFAIHDTCPIDTTTCLYSTATTANPDVIEDIFLAAGTYYLMIDTWPAPDNATFTLNITECGAGACCSTAGCFVDYLPACAAAGGTYAGDDTVCGDDCDNDGTVDICEILLGAPDCQGNGIPDNCDISSGSSNDADQNGVPDECDPDCNTNGIPDVLDIILGTSEDCQPDGTPDECQLGANSVGSGKAVTDFAYGVSNGDDAAANFQLSTPTVVNLGGTAVSPSGNFLGAGDFGPEGTYEFMYVIEGGAPHNLFKMDVTTGAMTAVGPTSPNGGESFVGMAWDGSKMYANTIQVDGSGNVLAAGLYEINLSTGASTLVANVSPMPFMISLAADCEGNLYTVDIAADELGMIDKATGAYTTVGALGFDTNYGQGLDYDAEAGELYMTTINVIIPGLLSQSELRRFNQPLDGSSTFIDLLGEGGTQFGFVGSAAGECVSGADCTNNYVPDECDIAGGTSTDCNLDGIPDDCQDLGDDCNLNGIPDVCDLIAGTSEDCNENALPDECDIASGSSLDCQLDQIPDECQLGTTPSFTVQDGSFEGGTPNAAWDEGSTNFGTPLCDPNACDSSVGSGPRTGNWWVWFGGVGDATFEAGYVEQAVTVPAGSPTLEFYAEIASSGGNAVDFARLLIDGNTEWEVFEDTTGYETYTLVQIDLTAYADNKLHTIRFESETTGTPAISNFFIDDVVLNGPVGVPTNDCNANGIPDDCELCGDLDGDSDVDYDDYVLFLNAFGRSIGEADYLPCADYDDTLTVGLGDYTVWLTCYRDYIDDPNAGPPSPRRFQTGGNGVRDNNVGQNLTPDVRPSGLNAR